MASHLKERRACHLRRVAEVNNNVDIRAVEAEYIKTFFFILKRIHFFLGHLASVSDPANASGLIVPSESQPTGDVGSSEGKQI